MEGIIIADKKRGVFAQADGTLFFTEPNTFKTICPPFFVPPPFRIYIADDIYPFIIAFCQDGVIFVFDVKNCKCTITTTLPPIKCIITKAKVLSEGKIIELTTENGKFRYDGYWRIIEEDTDKLVVHVDQKVNSEYSKLENEICEACNLKNMAIFKRAVERYCVYMAQHSSFEKFMECWFDLINRSTKLGKIAIAILKDSVDTLEGFELIQPHIDELRMALCTARI